jgi:hypothetical protein
MHSRAGRPASVSECERNVAQRDSVKPIAVIARPGGGRVCIFADAVPPGRRNLPIPQTVLREKEQSLLRE